MRRISQHLCTAPACFSFSFTHFILKTPDYGTPPSAYTPEVGFVTRRSVPAGGIGCEPACVRAPLKSVSHPNWLTAAPPNGPPSTLSALSLADSRKTLALGLLIWDGNGAWRWHLVPGYLGGPFYDKGGGAAPGSNPLSPRLRMTPLRGHQIKWSFHAGMGELKG